MKQAIIAFMLSAFVMPGLGQIYIGRKVTGIILVTGINFLLIASLFIALKISSPIIAENLAGTAVTFALIVEKAQPYETWTKLLLVAFFALWGFGLIDLLRSFRKGGGTA